MVLFCSRQKSTVKTRPADVRRVHFSTVGGLHGVRLPRLKNLFFKNRFPPTLGEYTSPPSEASTACARQGQRTYFPKTLSADVRRVHFSTVGGLHGVRLPRQKNSLYKKAASAERISGNRNLKIQLTTRMGICNTPHHAVGTAKILSLTVSRHPRAVCGAPRRRLCRRRNPSCRGRRQRSRRGRMPGSSRQSRHRGHGMRP